MKEFIYDIILDENQAKKIVRRLIYTFFKGNIQKKKLMVKGELKDKTRFSFKRPFNSSYDTKACTPHMLNEVFSDGELYVLRHYNYKNNQLPLFLASNSQIQADLEDIDNIFFYEYSYIFDNNFSYCFFVTDSVVLENEKNVALLNIYEPI